MGASHAERVRACNFADERAEVGGGVAFSAGEARVGEAHDVVERFAVQLQAGINEQAMTAPLV